MSIEISDEEWDRNKPMYARQYAKKMLSAFGYDSAKRIIEREVAIEQTYTDGEANWWSLVLEAVNKEMKL
jgi:hypothetical protein